MQHSRHPEPRAVLGVNSSSLKTMFGRAIVLCLAISAAALEIPVGDGQTMNYTTAIGTEVSSLVKTGPGRLHLQQGTRLNAFNGTIRVAEGTLSADSPNNLGRPTAVTVESGATLDLSAPEGNTDIGYLREGTLTIAGSGFDNAGALRRASGGADADLFWGFTLAGDALFHNDVRCSTAGTIDFNGHTLEKRGNGEFLISGTTCRNMGNIVLDGGQLTIQAPNCQFDGGPENVLETRSGTLCLWSSPGVGSAPPWTLSVVNSIWLTTGSTDRNVNAWDGPVNIPHDRVLTVNPWMDGSEITLAGPVDNQGAIQKLSAGTLLLTGPRTTNDYIAIEGGAVRFKGDGTGRHELGQATTANAYGEIAFESAGYVHQYRGDFWIAGNGNNLNSVIVTNTVLDGRVSPENSECSRIALGFGNGFNGRLVIDAGAVVSNHFSVGAEGRGAIHQRGGDVYWQFNNSYGYDQFAVSGYAFYGLDAGTVVRDRAWMGTAIWSPNACSFFVQRGGAFTGGGDDLILSAKGYAELYVGGGTHVQDSPLTLGSDNDYPEAGGATVTVANGGALSIGGNPVRMLHTNGFVTVVNLNTEGSLTCGRINTYGKGAAFGSETYLNFNGGVLRPSHACGFTDEWNASQNDPTRATVYDGGLIVDPSDCQADGDVARIPFALQRPYGRGIKSITLPPSDSEFWQANFLGPTRIRITGGGKAATALVDFDLATSRPRGVIITSPGFGYDGNTTVTVDSWDGQTNYPCAYELFEHQATGGFTLRGTMGLTLAGANTWGGPTTVESGFLAFEGTPSYPQGSPLVLHPAGTVDFYGVPRTIPSVTGAGRIQNGDVIITKTLYLRAADVLARASLNLTHHLIFEEGATIELLDPENLGDSEITTTVVRADAGIVGRPILKGLDPTWGISVQNNRIAFGRRRGTMLILR